jgi:predicted nucleotidyltransferase
MPETRQTGVPPVLRDRDIFEDREGRVYVTLGYIQPRDRVIALLKYVQDRGGKWKSGGRIYRRVFWGGVDSVVDGISMLPSDYVTIDSHFGTRLVEPPREAIAKYYSPESKLQGILKDGPKDRLEGYAARAAQILNSVLDIPLENLGIAGSILWSAHSPKYSDVNMNVYGLKASTTLSKSYDRLAKNHDSIRLRRLDEWSRAMERVRSRVPVLVRSDLENMFRRRNAICVDDMSIGITPVLLPDEAPITHGSERYEAVLHKPVQMKVTIGDSTYGAFNPALYLVDAEPNDALEGVEISRVLVYDGAFTGLFRKGDRVEVSGVPQSVSSPDGEVMQYQLMVGTKAGSGREYMRFID